MRQVRQVRRVLLAASVLAAACGAPPKLPPYQPPAVTTGAAWSTPAPFRPGDPKDAIPKGAWWTVFKDDELNGLVGQALAANQTIAEAKAQLDQARALTAIALSALYPHVSIPAGVQDQRLSATRALGGGVAATQPSWTLPVTASYEVDLFGKRVKSIESAQASLQASAAALENTRLVIVAEVASDYFTLRQLDTELDILARTVDAFGQALTLIENRHTGGIASGLDVAQEQALLASTKTTSTLVRQQRDEFEHALAVLTGQPAPAVHLSAHDMTVEPPAFETGIPTDVLERRPDVAEAEREMAAANARIGIARAAYFPSIDLTGGGGWQSGSLLKLFDVSSMVWAIGASLTQDLFTGGARQAQMAFAVATFNQTAAAYRQTVLQALAEIEDDLSGLAVLNEARVTQAQAVEASQRALDFANTRYAGGLVTTLDVVSAQETLLANQRLAAQIQGERLVTSVQLIKALGGGWDATSLAAIKDTGKDPLK